MGVAAILKVGLTGTSGAGKGYLCSFLEIKDNVLIIDTDALYHGMISYSSDCTVAISEEFGSVVLNDNGGIDRKKLASIVFSDKEALRMLNSISHYQILCECEKIISSSDKDICIIDAPQLFESGFNNSCDVTVAVVASKELRIDRIMKRDRISLEDALKRINNQHSDDWFRLNADIIIENESGDLSDKAHDLYTELVRLYGEKEKKKIQA